MSPADRLKINTSRVSYETIDGEVLIINFESGNYYSMSGTGAEIWAVVESEPALGDVVEAVLNRYEGDRTRIEEAVQAFIEQLREEALVVLENGDALHNFAGPGPSLGTNGDDDPRPFEIPVLEKHTDVQDLLILDPVHDVDASGWPTPKPPAGG